MTTSERPWDEPAPWVRFLRRYIWVIGIVFGLVMITGTRPFLMRRPEPPPVLAQLPSGLGLVDQDGRPFGVEELAGRTWVFGFVFTRCTTTCPAISGAMQRFQEQLEYAGLDRVGLVTVTVDPEHDSPSVLADYAVKLGADPERWRFVSGPVADIDQFVVGGFKLAVGDRAPAAQPGPFDIAHAVKLALVDGSGGVRGYYSIDDEGLSELFHRVLAVQRLEEGG